MSDVTCCEVWSASAGATDEHNVAQHVATAIRTQASGGSDLAAHLRLRYAGVFPGAEAPLTLVTGLLAYPVQAPGVKSPAVDVPRVDDDGRRGDLR